MRFPTIQAIALIPLALTLASCSFRPLNTLNIDPKMGPLATEKILRAVETWNEQGAGIEARISDSKKGGYLGPIDAKLCDGTFLAFTDLHTHRSASIYICNGKVSHDHMYMVALHELGHAISGRDHHLEMGHVMHEDVPDSQELTDGDLRYAGLL